MSGLFLKLVNMAMAAGWVWLSGTAALVVYGLVSYLRLRRLRQSRRTGQLWRSAELRRFCDGRPSGGVA